VLFDFFARADLGEVDGGGVVAVIAFHGERPL
jgi:hypothetical protein